MSFASILDPLPVMELERLSLAASTQEALAAACTPGFSWTGFARLLSPAAAAPDVLETLASQSRRITQQRFGKVIRLFAPLYLSNECINNCQYCGFSRDNPILRVTLGIEEVQREARALTAQGFRHVLLVAGEHPKFVSNGYVGDCLRALRPAVSSLSLELGPLSVDGYIPLVQAGAEGLIVYQETYDRGVYAELHTAGPKRDFDWRLATPERASEAGFRRIGIGALLGLANWRREAFALAAHADYLLRHCWKSQLTISLPRLRPCAGGFQPTTAVADRDLVQLICALRIAFPDVGIVLSTREPQRLRDGLVPLGVTLMSAGSHTEPGGYTGAGKEHLHRTERGRKVPLDADSSEWIGAAATQQFHIADDRPAASVANSIRLKGYEPVWKDWDQALGETFHE